MFVRRVQEESPPCRNYPLSISSDNSRQPVLLEVIYLVNTGLLCIRKPVNPVV